MLGIRYPLLFGIVFSLVILFLPQTDAALPPACVGCVTVSVPEGTSVPGCEETNECWDPPVIIVDVGATVTWSNDDIADHTVTSGNAADGPDGNFDSSTLRAGYSFSHTFRTSGDYPYFCIVHPWMVGTVIVADIDDEPEPTPTISVSTDKITYDHSSTIFVNGKVTNPTSRTLVTLTVISPANNVVTIDQLSIDTYGNFNTQLSTLGSLWADDGTYTIRVQYGNQAISNKALVELVGGDSTIQPSPIQLNIGVVHWLEASYPASGSGVVRVIDPDMNLNPEAVDNFDIDVWSDSDAGGIRLTVSETNKATGIFEGTVFFTTTYESSGHRLRVSEGDTITAEYRDNTLPDPYTSLDVLDITGTALIRDSSSPSNVSFTNPRIVDEFGNTLHSVSVGQEIQIAADIENQNNFEQIFVYYVKVRETVHEAWISGTLSAGQSFTPALSWTPNAARTYTIDITIFDDIERQNVLAPTLTIRVVVGSGDGTILDTIPPKILQPKDIVVDASNSNGAIVTYEVLAIDNEDGIVKPSCSPSSGSLFSIGDTKVVCSAFDSSGNAAPQKSFLVTVNSPSLLIPNWIKEVAAFWCDDKIDDASFIDGIQYLIENEIIIVQATTSGSGGTQEIPSWVKNIACWWSQGLIADKEFASGLEYLIGQGIIQV